MTKRFENIKDLTLQRDVSAKALTSFKAGGKASIVLYPETKTAFTEAIKAAQGNFTVIGNGSNILMPDSDYNTPIICTVKMREITLDGSLITASSGASLTSLALKTAQLGIKGFEFLYGIPGTVGGAVKMNAGAYGSSISDILSTVTVATRQGDIYTLSSEECELDYRHARFFQSGEIILEASFKGEKGEKTKIQNKMDDLMAQRKAKQPLEYPSAGSYFKRPEGHFAGKLIEDAGLKGLRVGGAMVSEKHAGFIINYCEATTDDILKLEEKVRSAVFKEFGVTLECEVQKLKAD